MSLKAKFWIYWSVYVPTLNCDHEVLIGTERPRFWIQADETNLFLRVARHWREGEELGEELLLLCINRSKLRRFI